MMSAEDRRKPGNQDCLRLRRIGSPASLPTVRDIFTINKEVTVIGRNAEQADIFLDSSKSKALISRLHARIISSYNKVGKPVFKICDTSLNGTYVNDVKISDTVEIMPGDTLTFGHLRGAVLDPGTFSQQTNSEFRFKFELLPSRSKETLVPPSQPSANKLEIEEETDLPEASELPLQHSPSQKTPVVPTVEGIPDLSVFLSPNTPTTSRAPVIPSTLSYPQNNRPRDKRHINAQSLTDEDSADSPVSAAQGTKCQSCSVARTPNQELGRDEPESTASDPPSEDEALFAFAAAAQGAMSESDDELFSPHFLPDPTPSGSASPVYPPLGWNDSPVTETTTSKDKTKSVHRCTGGNGSGSRKRRRSRLTYKKNTKKSGNSTNIMTSSSHDLCAAIDCVMPHKKDEIVHWVACDDCDSWYHIKCTGLTLKAVVSSAAVFHCGCV